MLAVWRPCVLVPSVPLLTGPQHRITIKTCIIQKGCRGEGGGEGVILYSIQRSSHLVTHLEVPLRCDLISHHYCNMG